MECVPELCLQDFCVQCLLLLGGGGGGGISVTSNVAVVCLGISVSSNVVVCLGISVSSNVVVCFRISVSSAHSRWNAMWTAQPHVSQLSGKEGGASQLVAFTVSVSGLYLCSADFLPPFFFLLHCNNFVIL